MAGWLTGDLTPGDSLIAPDKVPSWALQGLARDPNIALTVPDRPDVNARINPATVPINEKPTSVPPGATPAPDVPLAPPNSREAVVNFWVDKGGVPPHVAEAIADSVARESNFRSTAWNPDDEGLPSGGFYQHHAGRLLRLQQFAQSQGKSWQDPTVQNEFALKEVMGGDPIAAQHWNEIKNAPDRATAQTLWDKYFERGVVVGPSLKQQWNMPISQMSPDMQAALQAQQQISGKTADQFTQLFNKYRDAAAAAPPGSKERDEAIADMRRNSHEMMEMYRQMMLHPPEKKPIDAWQGFGAALIPMMLLGGKFARGHLTAAMGAAGDALQAIANNKQRDYEDAFKKWQTQSEMGLKMIEMENQDIKSLIDDKKMAVDDKLTQLQTMATEMGMVKQLGDIQRAPLDHYMDVLEKRETAANNINNTIKQVQFQNAMAEYQRVFAQTNDPQQAMEAFNRSLKPGAPSESVGREADIQKAVKEKDDQFAKDNPNATDAEKTAAHTKNTLDVRRDFSQATHAPRSAPAIYAQKFIQEHPEADSDAIAMAMARYRALGAMEQAFGPGAQGNTIRALNVAIDHTDVLGEVADALQNGDVQRLNSLKNQMLVEFGHEGPVDFDVAKKIVNDEIIKSVLGVGAGTGQERLELQGDFDRALSPEQLHGVIRTARRLMLGQMRGLEFQYAGGDPKRSEVFRDKLFPHTKEALEGTDQSATKPNGVTPPSTSTMPTVTNQEQYDALPPGAPYLGPDGTTVYHKGVR